MAKVTCTTCEGSKQSFMHVHYANKPHEWGYFPCRRCKGTGEIPEESLKWQEEGKQLEVWKRQQRITLRELAKMTGTDLVTISNYLQGKEKMPDAIKELMKGELDANR